MKAETGNGGVTWRWIVSVLVLMVGALVMGFGGYLKGEIANDRSELIAHEKMTGHPVVVERIDTMRDDIEEIKVEQRNIQRGVNELLRRVPPK